MKSWHIVVMDKYKIVEDIQKFDVSESRTTFEAKKEEYKDKKTPTGGTYSVKREYY